MVRSAHRAGAAIALAALFVGVAGSPGAAEPNSGSPAIAMPDLLSRLIGCPDVGGSILPCQVPGPARGLRLPPDLRLGARAAALPDAAGCPAGIGIPEDNWCERWVTRRGLGPWGVAEVPYAAEVSPDGSEIYVLAYYATAEPDIGAAILVGDAQTGGWRRTMPIPFTPLGKDSEFFPSLLATSPDGMTILVSGSVCGRTETPSGFARYHNALTAAFSRTGEQLWLARYQGPTTGPCGSTKGEAPAAIEIAPDGSTVYVTGISTGTGEPEDAYPPYDVVTLAYDADTGAQRWVERFDSGQAEAGTHLAIGEDGSLYVSTRAWSGRSTVLTYREVTAPSGPELAWSHTEDPAFFGWPVGIGVAQGRVLLAGISTSNPSNTIDYSVLALDADGERLWRANHSNVYTIAGVDYTSVDVPVGMAIAGGRVYLTGLAFEWDVLYGLGDPAPAIVGSTTAFDLTDGRLAWNHTYRFPGHRLQFPTAVNTAGGHVYVTGVDSECNFLMGPGYWCESRVVNLVSLDYDPVTGELARVARYNHNRGIGTEVAPISPPLGPAWNWPPKAAAGPGGELYLATNLEVPCLGECSSLQRYGLGVVAY